MTKDFIKYVLREHHCPNCGKKGSLFVRFMPRKTGGWFGPYFYVTHTRVEHDPKTYAQKSKELGKCPLCHQSLVGTKSYKKYYESWRLCYFGKDYPNPIPVPIPSPSTER